jgi:hypothetical protein
MPTNEAKRQFLSTNPNAEFEMNLFAVDIFSKYCSHNEFESFHLLRPKPLLMCSEWLVSIITTRLCWQKSSNIKNGRTPIKVQRRSEGRASAIWCGMLKDGAIKWEVNSEIYEPCAAVGSNVQNTWSHSLEDTPNPEWRRWSDDIQPQLLHAKKEMKNNNMRTYPVPHFCSGGWCDSFSCV